LAVTHAFTELRTLSGLSALPVSAATRDALEHVLGGRGITATTRLGLPTGADPARIAGRTRVPSVRIGWSISALVALSQGVDVLLNALSQRQGRVQRSLSAATEPDDMCNSSTALATARTATTTPFAGPAREPEPRWTRPAYWALLLVTALIYPWNLGASEYYAAAVQSGTQSWKVLLFGSIDSSNAITVDKPPASLWVMGL